ncbi:MAG TPA: hypothetical protein PKI62_10820 [bacterium]|nr:hypothetical protein [bacterium]HPR89263.1 hypothetical protein [bacterium]
MKALAARPRGTGATAPRRSGPPLESEGETPLLFKSWRSWYILVIATLAAIILLLSWATQALR